MAGQVGVPGGRGVTSREAGPEEPSPAGREGGQADGPVTGGWGSVGRAASAVGRDCPLEGRKRRPQRVGLGGARCWRRGP